MNTFRNPNVVLSQWGGERFLYLSNDAAVAVSKSGELITVMGKNDFGPAIKQILKEAGR